jgi:hypothetical protein
VVISRKDKQNGTSRRGFHEGMPILPTQAGVVLRDAYQLSKSAPANVVALAVCDIIIIG